MNPEHLKIEQVPQTRPGGQQVGLHPPHIRVTHIPTGLVAECATETSQYKCMKVAVAMIEYGLAESGWKDQTP